MNSGMQEQGAVMSLSDFTNCKQNGAEENDTEKKKLLNE